MTEVAEYIDKRERSQSEEGLSPVSSKPIELAARDLAYNLTEWNTGMAHMQIREAYAQLRDAIDVLQDKQVLSHFGGARRQTLSRVIEALWKQEYQRSPNFSALRTLAVEGYSVLKIVSEIGDSALGDESTFENFLDSTETWTIAAGSEEEESLDELEVGDESEEDLFDAAEEDELTQEDLEPAFV